MSSIRLISIEIPDAPPELLERLVAHYTQGRTIQPPPRSMLPAAAKPPDPATDDDGLGPKLRTEIVQAFQARFPEMLAASEILTLIRPRLPKVSGSALAYHLRELRKARQIKLVGRKYQFIQ